MARSAALSRTPAERAQRRWKALRGRQPSPASCRACPRGQRGVAGGTSPHAGGARPRGRRSSPTQPVQRGPQRFPARRRQSAPSLAATGISHCSYLWSRLAQFVATELDSTMRDFNSIAADVDLSMKSWLGRLRSGGPCHRCTIHNQQAILPLMPAAATLRQPHRHRRRYSQVPVRGVRRPAPALLRAEEAGAGQAEPKLHGHVGRAGSQQRRRAPPAANQLLFEALRHIGWSTMNVRAWACLDAAGEHA